MQLFMTAGAAAGVARSAVIKIGGHVLFDGVELNVGYVRELKDALVEAAGAYDWLAVVVGGGELARRYVEWGRELGLNDSALDMIGIRVAATNAALLWAYFHGVAPPSIPSSLQEAVAMLPAWRVVFLGGLQPAQSTTTVAALLAEAVRAEKLVIATDVDGVYSDDPRRNPAATRFEEIAASELEKMFSGGLVAGGYRLLDPLTLAVLRRSGIEAYVVAGRPPRNIVRALRGERIGTRILPK